MATRIYKVTVKGVAEPKDVRLVEASNQYQAVKHVVNDMVEVSAATAKETGMLVGKGYPIEVAKQTEEATP